MTFRSFILRLLGLQSKYGVPSTTLLGERVKSRAEKRIADYLFTNGIKYQYEKIVKTGGFGERIAKADFFLTDYNVVVEYWGMVNVEDKKTNSKYVRQMRWKMAMYFKHRIDFISIYPCNLDNLDWVFRTKFKQVTGRDLPPVTNKH